MSTLVIKHKEFEIIEILSNNVFKCSFKNKEYIVHKLDTSDSHYKDNVAQLNKLVHSGVKQPKLKFLDKKSGYLVREYIEGINLFDYILEHDFDENIYKKVFFNSYSAKVCGLTLNYDLKSWILVNDDLYYIGLFSQKYNPENDFTKSEIRKWFLGKELEEYYKNNGVLIDKTRIKNEFSVNKEMVLMTCKYYM